MIILIVFFFIIIIYAALSPNTTEVQKQSVYKAPTQPTYREPVQQSSSLSATDDGWVWMRASYADRLALSNAMAKGALNQGVKVSGEYLKGCIDGFYDEAKYGQGSIETMDYKISFVAALCSVS